MPNRKKKFELSPRLKLGVGRARSQNQILKIASIFCLVLATVLVFYAFRLVLGSKNSTVANIGAGQVLGASDVKPSATGSQVQFMDYTVQKGDTLFNVSQKYNISWSTLATINSLKSPYTLKPGQVLKIPK